MPDYQQRRHALRHPCAMTAAADMSIDNRQSRAWINDYVGVPYRHNGRDRAGWDCWGLVLAVYRDRLGLTLPDWRWSEPFDLSAKLRAFGAAFDQVEAGAALELEAPEPFAIALVCYQGRAWPHHVGVVAGAGVLHAASTYGGTLYDPLPRFLKTFSGVTWWRWRQ